MALQTRYATSWFDDGKRVECPAGTPVRIVDNVAVALAGDDHLQGLVAGRVKALQAVGESPAVVTLRGRVRVLRKSELVEVGRS